MDTGEHAKRIAENTVCTDSKPCSGPNPGPWSCETTMLPSAQPFIRICVLFGHRDIPGKCKVIQSVIALSGVTQMRTGSLLSLDLLTVSSSCGLREFFLPTLLIRDIFLWLNL